MVSSMGAGNPPPAEGASVFGDYLRAKAAADRALQESGLEYTIVRPGGLTNEPGTGRVERRRAARDAARSRAPTSPPSSTPASLPRTIGRTFELITGEHPIDEALASL